MFAILEEHNNRHAVLKGTSRYSEGSLFREPKLGLGLGLFRVRV